MENRDCQNCHNTFTIQPEDFVFYDKIHVPAPTWCPECRLMRKMARRNERSLYRRKCDYCHTDVVSMYPQNSALRVFCNNCWWSDKWDSMEYGQTYEPAKTFFSQFDELTKKVPRLALYQKNAVNSPYTNHTDGPKNCYLSFDCARSEDAYYSKWVIESRDIFDCYGIMSSELCYESQLLSKCSRAVNLINSSDCLDSAFLYNCKGCSHCLLSSNLRNKNYVYRNQEVGKEEYEKILSGMDMGSYAVREELMKVFSNEILPATVRKYATTSKIVNSTGDNLFECKNVAQGFHVYESEDSKFCVDDANLKDCYDTYEAGFNCERQYDCHACNRTSNSMFSSISYDDHHLQYCEMCHNSSDLFGCIGLRNKQYCILNKQYSKEEYEALLPKIIEQMRAAGEYGEFFPISLSPFAYNESVAQEYFPLTKSEVSAKRFRWKDAEAKSYQVTVTAENLPDKISDVTDEILKQVIGCAHNQTCNEQCTLAFKLTPQELNFYRNLNLPLPRLCPNCRHYERLFLRNPLRLWHRKCMKPGCNNEFETSYAPDRPEVVYCERCYQQEVA